MAWHLGVPAASIALDHLLAWRALRMDARIQPSFAHFTLVRAAMEGVAVARWLTEALIDSAERVRRAAGVQLADSRQRRAYEEQANFQPGPEGRTATQRIAALERLLRRTGCAATTMPSATVLFGLYVFTGEDKRLRGEQFFRLISAISHGKVWSLFGISDVGDVISVEHARRAAPVSAHDELAFTATGLAMRLASAAVRDIERYGTVPVADGQTT
jgi:hypothetical protein